MILAIGVGYISNVISMIGVKERYRELTVKLGADVSVTGYIPYVLVSRFTFGSGYSLRYDVYLFDKQALNIYDNRP